MPAPWPRNIIPYTEEKLRALSTVASVALYDAALDHPLVEEKLEGDQLRTAHALIEAGLLTRRGGALVPTERHRRDPETDVPGVVEHKRAVIGFLRTILDDTERALDARGHDAQAAAGFVTLPDRPETVARAIAIIAEAEDHLRALAEEFRDKDAPQMRVVVYAGSR